MSKADEQIDPIQFCPQNTRAITLRLSPSCHFDDPALALACACCCCFFSSFVFRLDASLLSISCQSPLMSASHAGFSGAGSSSVKYGNNAASYADGRDAGLYDSNASAKSKAAGDLMYSL